MKPMGTATATPTANPTKQLNADPAGDAATLRRRVACVGRGTAALTLAALLAAGGCTLNGTGGDPVGGEGGAGVTGSGGAVGASSRVPRDVRLFELSQVQAVALCDWTNLTEGGYGRRTTCPSGDAQSTNASTQDCVNGTAALGGRCNAVTVGNIEDCARAVGTDLCKFESAAACVVVATCGA